MLIYYRIVLNYLNILQSKLKFHTKKKHWLYLFYLLSELFQISVIKYLWLILFVACVYYHVKHITIPPSKACKRPIESWPAFSAAAFNIHFIEKCFTYNCVEDRKSKLNSTYKQTTRDSVGSWAFMMRHSYANPSEPHSNGVGQIVIYIVTSRFFVRTYQKSRPKLLADFIAAWDIAPGDIFVQRCVYHTKTLSTTLNE